MIEATAAPSRALPVADAKSVSVRLGLATLAAGAVTTAAVGVTWASTNGASAETNSDTASQVDSAGISAARQSRTGSAEGAVSAFTSRDTERQNLDTVAQAAATARTQALTAATDKFTTASVTATATTRQTALTKAAANVTKEEERRKEDGWQPGGKNPVFLRPVVGGTFSSPFGWRTNPVTGASELHSGQDIAIGCGTPILAPQDGTVVYQGYMGSGGNALRIEHGKYNGKDIVSGYYHAESYTVSVGDKVTRGQVVGYVGTTGTSTGCHLHYMIFEDGTNVNPVPYIEGAS